MPLAEAGCASSGGVPSLIGTGDVSDGARSWCSAYTAATVGGIAGFLLSLFIPVRVADTVRVSTRVPVRHSVIMGLCQQMGH